MRERLASACQQGDLSAGKGVDQSLLSTTEITNGSVQVTYAGMPLYQFAGDAEPGDTNGQGSGDVWFVVSPKGQLCLDGC